MGIINYVKDKYTQSKIQKTNEEKKDIIITINDTIKSLSTYRKKLIKGKIYPTQVYANDERQKGISDAIIDMEKGSIARSIRSLKKLREDISSGRIADAFLQYENNIENDSFTME